MATPMTSTQFRSIVEPILNQEFDGIYDQRADEWKEFLKQETGIARSYHEEPVLYGMGSAPELPEGTPVVYDSGGVLFIARYVYKVFGIAFSLTKTLVEDGDHIRLGRIFSRHMAQSMVETEETVSSNILNRAFNSAYTGGDGVSLSNASHPLAGGGTWSNLLTAAAVLSQTSVEQLAIQIRKATDWRGKKIRLMPKRLIISPDNVMQAEVILKSVLRSGNADNDVNPIKSLGLFPDGASTISRLTSTTAWWIQTDVQEGLKMLNRRKNERSMEGDFDTDSMRYKTTARYIPGWTDPHDLYGTAGV
tara:strand:+ start:3052 stop:3969 length:918 start_codon:yes stop_codon:yes gene_type:complete